MCVLYDGYWENIGDLGKHKELLADENVKREALKIVYLMDYFVHRIIFLEIYWLMNPMNS